jgi:phage replication-related protein YjqB (UPF0714/DUF867 family)
MPDIYRNFCELARMEDRDSFSIHHKHRLGTNVIIAPHGGGIEPGTSELAEAIAGDDLSFYTFDGRKKIDNEALHITSTRFDEPDCLRLLDKSPTCIAIHGEGSANEVVFLGGLNRVMAGRIRVSLQSRGFKVDIHTRLQGTDPENICNCGKTRRGVQLELSKGLRRMFFENLTRKGRQVKTERFYQFVAALREAIVEPQ